MLLVVPFGDKKAFGKGHLPYCNTAKEGRKKREQSQVLRICKGQVCCQKKRGEMQILVCPGKDGHPRKTEYKQELRAVMLVL